MYKQNSKNSCGFRIGKDFGNCLAICSCKMAASCGIEIYDIAYTDKLDSAGQAMAESHKYRDELHLIIHYTEEMKQYSDISSVVDNLLEKLNITYADLCVLEKGRAELDIEIWKTLSNLKKQKKIINLGVFGYTISELKTMMKNGIIPEANQIPWNLSAIDFEMYQFCKENGIQIYVFGKYEKNAGDRNIELIKIGEKYCKSPMQIFLKWCLQQGMIPLVETAMPMHIQECAELDSFEISKNELEKISDAFCRD